MLILGLSIKDLKEWIVVKKCIAAKHYLKGVSNLCMDSNKINMSIHSNNRLRFYSPVEMCIVRVTYAGISTIWSWSELYLLHIPSEYRTLLLILYSTWHPWINSASCTWNRITLLSQSNKISVPDPTPLHFTHGIHLWRSLLVYSHTNLLSHFQCELL